MNEFEFGFPYRDPQRATLQFRDHPRFGRNVILTVERGQFLCRSRDCSVRVRFGDAGSVTYEASEPDSNIRTILFIRNYDRFLARTKEVDRVLIEASFFQEGNRVFQFDVSGLDWP